MLTQFKFRGLREVLIFPREVILNLHYSCLLNGNQLAQAQNNKPTTSYSGNRFIMQYHSSNLFAKSSHGYLRRIKKKENY
jgi:hypothetical protein